MKESRTGNKNELSTFGYMKHFCEKNKGPGQHFSGWGIGGHRMIYCRCLSSTSYMLSSMGGAEAMRIGKMNILILHVEFKV